MLPDFPGEKGKMRKVFELFAWATQAGCNPWLNQFPKFMLHEGNSMLRRETDGSLRPEPLQQVDARMEVHRDDVPSLSFHRSLEMARVVGRQLAEGQARLAARRIQEVTEAAGTHFAAAAESFTADTILDAIERLEEVSFDRQGRPELVGIVHPGVARLIQANAAKWEADPEFVARWKAVLDRKYEEWREREANRRLVD